MTARVQHTTFDCADVWAVAGFWRELTGYVDDPDDPNQPGDTEVLLIPAGGGPGLLFAPVPEGKTVKNRLHLCMTPVDRTRDEEVAHLLTLGATQVSDQRTEDGAGWVVLADPEGNEFCVLRSDAERGLSA